MATCKNCQKMERKLREAANVVTRLLDDKIQVAHREYLAQRRAKKRRQRDKKLREDLLNAKAEINRLNHQYGHYLYRG